MATSDDGLPKSATTGQDDDGDTTAAAVAKVVPKLVDGDEEEEDRTVQQKFNPRVRDARPPASRPVPPPARPAPAAPLRMTSKKPTAVGLGAPPVMTRPAAGYVPSPPAHVTAPADKSAQRGKDVSGLAPPRPAAPSQADAADDSITATAPVARPREGAPLPITMPGDVKITELVDEPLDETEVRTLVAAPTMGEGPAGSGPTPAAGAPPRTEADEPDDSVTTQAPSPLSLLNDDDDLKTSPPRLPPQPMPAAGRRPSEAMSAAPPVTPSPDDDYGGEESVTTRGPAVDYEDDSVTAQAPVASPPGKAGSGRGIAAALAAPPAFDETDGTTKRVARRGDEPGRPGSRPDAGGRDAPSITAEAPAGHLSNMLRVIAGPASVEDQLDDMPENRTAVMVNAPVKPPYATPSGSARAGRPMVAPHGGGRVAAIADLRAEMREPSSDSGLRVAGVDAAPGEHASPDVLLGGAVLHADRRSGVGPSHDSVGALGGRGPNPFAKTEKAFAMPPRGFPPNPQEYDFASTIKKPRYGLLVGVVAVLSFAIPLLLFLLLHSSASEPLPRERSEPAPVRVERADPPRGKAVAPSKATASASAAPAPAAPPGPRRNDVILRRR